MNNIKLIATDMDGTFLNNQMDYDRELFDKLYKKLTQKDIKFVVASGNQYYQLRSFFEDYPDILYVAENGSLIGTTNEILETSTFNSAIVKKIVPKLLSYPDLQIVVCGVKSAYILIDEEPEFIEHTKKFYYQLTKVTNFENIEAKDKILKFALTCPVEKTQEVIKWIQDNLSEYGIPTSSGHGDIDIIQPGVNKATGLQKVGKLLDIDLKQMCAFGDGGNDLEMINEVGCGVAIENAAERVKEVSDKMTVSNQEQGVLKFIEQHILD